MFQIPSLGCHVGKCSFLRRACVCVCVLHFEQFQASSSLLGQLVKRAMISNENKPPPEGCASIHRPNSNKNGCPRAEQIVTSILARSLSPMQVLDPIPESQLTSSRSVSSIALSPSSLPLPIESHTATQKAVVLQIGMGEAARVRTTTV